MCIIQQYDTIRKRKMKKLTKKLSILNAYIDFSISKVSNFRADNKEFTDIILSENTKYNIIGKVLGTNTGLIF